MENPQISFLGRAFLAACLPGLDWLALGGAFVGRRTRCRFIDLPCMPFSRSGILKWIRQVRTCAPPTVVSISGHVLPEGRHAGVEMIEFRTGEVYVRVAVHGFERENHEHVPVAIVLIEAER